MPSCEPWPFALRRVSKLVCHIVKTCRCTTHITRINSAVFIILNNLRSPGKERPLFVAFTDVHVVNTPTKTDFKLPTLSNQLQSWEEMCKTGSLQLGQASPQTTGYLQGHNLLSQIRKSKKLQKLSIFL